MLKGQGKISRREAFNFLPTRLQRENVVILDFSVTIRYVLPTRLQRVNAVIVRFWCNHQVCSAHEVAVIIRF